MENKSFFLFRYWSTHPLLDFHVGLAVIAVALSLISKVAEEPSYGMISDILAIFLILHYFIHGFYYRQHRFISDNQRVYSMPRKKIARISAILLAGFMFFICVGMALAKELYTGTLYEKVKALIMYILGMIFGALLDNDGLGRDDPAFADHKNVLGVMNGVTGHKEGIWDTILNSIQSVLIVVGLLALVILCVSLLINYVKNRISGFTLKGRKEIALDVSDREEGIFNRRNKRKKLLDFSPEARIRSLYRRSIKQHKGQNRMISPWMTPAEIETIAQLPSQPYYKTLHELYEKARYSQDGCTAEDVNQVKAQKS